VRKNDIPEIRCSYGRIKKIHNWKPKISIDYGLAKTYDYYLNMKKSKK
jgi:nucleoside-diphosphate-sugar epimerase